MKKSKNSEKIEYGYTMWARQIVDSEIFTEKPPSWFKIWFYIVSHVNWDNKGKYARGTGYFNFSNLKNSYLKGISPDVYKKCIHFLKMSTMISTKKSTRGMSITVLNYGKYQAPENYQAPYQAQSYAQQKHNRSTTITKEGKKEINKKEINKEKSFFSPSKDLKSSDINPNILTEEEKSLLPDITELKRRIQEQHGDIYYRDRIEIDAYDRAVIELKAKKKKLKLKLEEQEKLKIKKNT